MRIGVFGATGQVGGVMCRLVAERGLRVDEIRLFASARSAGTLLEFAGRKLKVEDSATADFAGLDVALFSNGKAASLVLAPRVAAASSTSASRSSSAGWSVRTTKGRPMKVSARTMPRGE